MGIKNYKSNTAGRRVSSVDDFSDITVSKPHKALTKPLKKQAGRNCQGKITVRHRGGGHKRRWREINWLQRDDVKAQVKTIEYDPNRSARIALIESEAGEKQYILAPVDMKVGQSIHISPQKATEVAVGNRTQLQYIPLGSMIYNIEIHPGKGGKLVRSAGVYATLQGREGEFAQLKMPSGEIRLFSIKCAATIGQVSNVDFRNIRWGKAGRRRWLGWRPTVRGKVMNPVDHPHGGGEGRNSIGLKHPKTPQGKPALGVKTRSKKKKSNKMIVKRRLKKK